MNYSITLTTTAYNKEQFPEIEFPQIALAGRSNVGKSSLINALAGRKALAKTSSTPGKTRSINFYWVTPGKFYLVDLPGYGYAKCSKQERQKWAELIEYYFQSFKMIKAVVVLLDCRLEPQVSDLNLTAYMQQQNIPLLPVLTKTDKCNMKQRSQTLKAWQEYLGQDSNPIFFSAKTNMGRNKLWNLLRQSARPDLTL